MNREALDSLDKEALIRLVLTQAETIAALNRRVEMLTLSRLEAENGALRTENAALREKLRLPPKTPDNSSTPPSQGRKPSADPAAASESTGRRTSHPGAHRPLHPDPTRKRDILADHCRHCGTSSLRHVFVLGEALEGQISLNTLAATPSERDDGVADIADLDPGDVALMLLSGGTTALPKLIPRTHNDYVYNFKQSARIGGFGPDTVLLAVLPLPHNYTLGSLRVRWARLLTAAAWSSHRRWIARPCSRWSGVRALQSFPLQCR